MTVALLVPLSALNLQECCPQSLGLGGGRDRGVGVDGRFTCTPQAAWVYLITFPCCSLKQVFQVNAEVVWLWKVWLQSGFCFFGFCFAIFGLFVFRLVFLSGGVASSYPSPATRASPVDGTAILWDTQRSTSFSRVLRDEDLLFSRICGVEGIWSGH